MAHWIELNAGDRVEVAVRRRANARRLSLRVSRADGQIRLTAPTWVTERQIGQFLTEHSGWIDDARRDIDMPVAVTDGCRFPVEGQMLTVAALSANRGPVRVDADRLCVPCAGSSPGPRLRGFLRELARARVVAACDRYSVALGRPFSAISLRDPRSRWGSCSASGGLMFSWRLAMAPPEVLDYVAAHEVAHLAEMNHSAAFWAEVEKLMPHYARPRKWLRAHGSGLHRWRFGD